MKTFKNDPIGDSFRIMLLTLGIILGFLILALYHVWLLPPPRGGARIENMSCQDGACKLIYRWDCSVDRENGEDKAWEMAQVFCEEGTMKDVREEQDWNTCQLKLRCMKRKNLQIEAPEGNYVR